MVATGFMAPEDLISSTSTGPWIRAGNVSTLFASQQDPAASRTPSSPPSLGPRTSVPPPTRTTHRPPAAPETAAHSANLRAARPDQTPAPPPPPSVPTPPASLTPPRAIPLQGSSTVEIHLSKRKTVVMLLGALLFVAACCALYPLADHHRFHSPAKVKLVAVAGVAFFGLVAVLVSIRIFDRRPALVIDSDGLMVHVPGIAGERVPWKEIRAITITTVSAQRMVTVVLKDPQKYAPRNNPLGLWMHNYSLKLTGSPINISTNTLRVNLDELHRLLSEAFERHKDSVDDPTGAA